MWCYCEEDVVVLARLNAVRSFLQACTCQCLAHESRRHYRQHVIALSLDAHVAETHSESSFPVLWFSRV